MASCHCQETDVGRILDLLDGAIHSIKSFDIIANTTTRRFMVFETHERTNEKGQQEFVVTVRRKLLPGESPAVSLARWVQLYSYRKGRIDFLEVGSHALSAKLIYDGEVQKYWVPNSRTLSISARGLGPVPDGMDYRSYWLTWFGDAGLESCLRERKTVISPGSEIILEAATDSNLNVFFNDWLLRVTVDPQHGFMPSVVETWMPVEGKPTLGLRRKVNRWKSIGGIWVPVHMTTTQYDYDPKYKETFGEVLAETDLEVDEARSSWNKPIPEDAFKTPLPAGTEVTDMRRGIRYTTGKPDTGENLDDLAANAKDMVTLRFLSVDPPWWTPTRIVVAAATVFGACAAIVLFILRRSRRAVGA
jgi:hypothetical protein